MGTKCASHSGLHSPRERGSALPWTWQSRQEDDGKPYHLPRVLGGRIPTQCLYVTRSKSTPLLSADSWQALTPKWVGSKNLPASTGGSRVRFPGWEDALEEEMATHSSVLIRRSPWTEEPRGLQSLGPPRAGHGQAAAHTLFPRQRQSPIFQKVASWVISIVILTCFLKSDTGKWSYLVLLSQAARQSLPLKQRS